MSVTGLVNQAVAWYAASAVLAFLFAMRKTAQRRHCRDRRRGGQRHAGGRRRRRAADAGADPRRHAAVSPPDDTGGGVNALWLLAISLSALPVSLFNISWHRHPQVKANGPLVKPAAGRRDLRGGGDQYRFTGGDGGDHGALRGVSHRLRRLR